MPLNKTQLASALGVTAPTLRAWMAKPDAPNDTDPDTWREYVAKNALGHSGPKMSQSSATLKDQKTEKEIERLDLIIAKEKRKLIDREEVRRLLLAISVRQRTILYQSCESDLPPKLDGLPASEARKLLRDMADGICDAMAGLVKEFEGA